MKKTLRVEIIQNSNQKFSKKSDLLNIEKRKKTNCLRGAICIGNHGAQD